MVEFLSTISVLCSQNGQHNSLVDLSLMFGLTSYISTLEPESHWVLLRLR